MSGEDRSTRPLSPESEGLLPSKKPKAGGSSEEASPPQGPYSSCTSPAPGTSGSRTPTRPRSASPKSPQSRSKSPLERVVAFFKKSPSPKPPSEGGSPKDIQETTERWVRGGSMSPPTHQVGAEPRKRSSSKGRPQQKVTFASEGTVGFDPLVDAFALRGVAYEQFSEEILREAGLPRLPPTASTEDLSSASETSQASAVASTSYSTAATMHPGPPPSGPADPM